MEKIKSKYFSVVEKCKPLDQFFQVLLLTLTAVYVFGWVIQTTMFEVYYGGELMSFSRGALLWVVIARVFFSLKHWKKLLKAGALCLLLFLLYQFRANSFLWLWGLIAMGSLGMDYQRFLRSQFFVVGITVFVAVIAALCGTVENLVYLKDGWKIRDSFGIIYPTDFASYLFYLFLFFWIAWKKIPGWVSALIAIPFLVVVRVYAVSDTCTICGLAFLLILLLFPFWERHIVRAERFPKLKKLLDLLLILAFPALAAFMFVLIAGYGSEVGRTSGFFHRINGILTHRLALAYRSFLEHGVSFTGSSLVQQGNGATTFERVGYDFVDSSYPLILLQNGWSVFLLVATAWIGTTIRAIRAKDYRLAFGMGLICLHSFVEHHFTEINYNILLYLPFAAFAEETVEKETVEKETAEALKSQRLARGLAIGMTMIVALCAPLWLAALRTICGAMRYAGEEYEYLFLVSVVLLSIAVIACLYFALKRKSLPWMAVCIALILAEAVGGVILSSRAGAVAEQIWAMDGDVLREMDDIAEGRMYSTEFPAFYRKKLKKLRYGILTGEDLARKENITVIVPRGMEYYVFFKKGFYYAAISEATSVYVNDESVIAYLREKGYAPKAYFDEVRYVELPTNTAPLINLRKGSYLITCKLLVTAGDEPYDTAAEVMIVGNKGIEILTKEPISAAKASGEGVVEHQFRLNLDKDTPGIMFYILGKDGYRIEVEEVSYQMMP